MKRLANKLKQAEEKSLKQRALEYLSKREYSAKELGNKLKAFADDTDDIPALIEDFTTRGWLSDTRFTEQVVRARKAKFGVAKVANELREKGVSDALVADAVADIQAGELDNAKRVWQKKFKQAASNRNEWAKQARFLQSRGFSFDTIKQVLNAAEKEDNE